MIAKPGQKLQRWHLQAIINPLAHFKAPRDRLWLEQTTLVQPHVRAEWAIPEPDVCSCAKCADLLESCESHSTSDRILHYFCYQESRFEIALIILSCLLRVEDLLHSIF